jgi:hypothetical protein
MRNIPTGIRKTDGPDLTAGPSSHRSPSLIFNQPLESRFVASHNALSTASVNSATDPLSVAGVKPTRIEPSMPKRYPDSVIPHACMQVREPTLSAVIYRS